MSITVEAGHEAGEDLRATKPPDWMASWAPPAGRDPKAVLDRAAVGRDRELVAERNELMARDGPRFLRGAAGIMAADLAATRSQTTGIDPDICGDAHVGNFGMYASPERRRVFDLTDFDEARPGPWEWDICRLATSAVVTARDRGLEPDGERHAAAAAVDAYARTLRALARGPLVERWYALTKVKSLEPADVGLDDDDHGGDEAVARATRLLDGADDDTQHRTVEKLVQDGAFKRDGDRQTPLDGPEADSVRLAYGSYLDTLSDALKRLLDGYEPTAVAWRPVGEGSLGLRNYLLLLCGLDEDDALILQVKEATPSLLAFGLEPYSSVHEGERVVRMQRALQAVSDPLLGWTAVDGQAFYVRQFRDRKGTPELERADGHNAGDFAQDLAAFARLCGVTLARAHARAEGGAEGGLAQMSGYIGGGDDRAAFCDAVVAFARAYADVTESDRRHLHDQSGPWGR